tara:strand:- start:5163 stop:5318 length:156 start_codon:yes stop_codon:yes gene_type:complete
MGDAERVDIVKIERMTGDRLEERGLLGIRLAQPTRRGDEPRKREVNSLVMS